MVFSGDPPFMYQISAFEAPFKLTMFTETSITDSEETESLPVVTYQISEQNGRFKVDEKFVLQVPEMARSKMDSLLTVFKKQPKHYDKYNENDPPFATEALEIELFLCAINGNQACLQAFENLEQRFVTDGAVASLYSELSYLVQVYKKDNNR
jgi:hypothetical protein